MDYVFDQNYILVFLGNQSTGASCNYSNGFFSGKATQSKSSL